VVLPTAYTHPEGTLYLGSSEIVLLQAGYAVSDSTQITATATPPLGEKEKSVLFDLSLKTAFFRDGPLRLAGISSISGIFAEEIGNAVLGRVGAVAQLCFEERCESSVSASTNLLLAGPATFMVNGVGGIWRVSRGAALLLEVDTLVPLGGETGEYSGVAVLPGFRFPYESWALDLCAGPAIDSTENPDAILLPWINFSYRFLP